MVLETKPRAFLPPDTLGYSTPASGELQGKGSYECYFSLLLRQLA